MRAFNTRRSSIKSYSLLTATLVKITAVITEIIEKMIMVLNGKDFPEDLHRQVKIQAVILGISLKELIILALGEYLKKQKISIDI